MSQHDMTVDNGAGVAVRADINLALKALASQSLGAVAPSTTYPGQVWADTGTSRLRRRDSTNTSWLDLGPIDTSPLAGFSTQVFSVAPATSPNHAVPLGQIQSMPPGIQSVGASVASNALTMTWAAQTLLFRNTSLTSGTPLSVTPPGTLSITVPSGATLGTVSGQQAQLVLLVAYNGGAPVLCVANISGGVDLSETGLISPTTISAGSTSASVIYSASAVSAGSPYRVVGYINITEATAGTWATAATLVQGAGGQALAAMQSVGYGQTLQSFAIGTQRVAGTTYVNTTSKPILLNVIGSVTNVGFGLTCSINGGSSFFGSLVSVANAYSSLICIVPPGATYLIFANGSAVTLTAWLELR